MAEEIEISNFGDGGVASEATLKSLLAAMEKMAGGGKSGAEASAKAQQMHNRAVESGIKVSTKNRDALHSHTDSVNTATKATSKFANKMKGAVFGAVGAVANGMVGLGTELISGGNRITDFTQHLPIIGSLFAPLGGYLEESLDSFRAVSDVGAGLGNSMMEVAQAAADTGMSLSEFSSFVKQNADALQAFGGGAAGGVREFQRLSKELRKGVGADLFNLGFTIQDMNEGLVTMAGIQARQIGVDRLNSRNLTNSTASYLTELDKLSRLTGKSREQMAEQMNQNSRDMRVRVAEAQMDEEQRLAFRTNLAAAGAQSDRFAEVLRDMADDRPDEEITKRFMTQSETFRRFAGEIENMSPEELQQFMVDVNKEVEAFALTMGDGVSAMDDATQEMFAVSGDLSTLQQMTAEERAKALAEQKERDKVTDAMSDFEKVIADVRTKILSALIDSGIFDALGTSLNGFKEIFEREDFKTALESLTTTIGNIATKITTFMNEFAAADNPGEFIQEKIKEAVEVVKTKIKDVFKDAMSGLKTMIVDSLTGMWDNASIITKVGVALAGLFAASSVVSSVTNGIKGLFGGGGGGGRDDRGGGNRRSGGGGNSRLGKALEGLGGGLLRGIATGLVAFANPLVPVGAAALGAAIVAIGAGIAGAAWITGQALPTFSEGMKSFENLDGDKLAAVGDGVTSLGVGLIAFGAGNVASAIGGITDMLAGFFGADSPTEKIAKMAKELEGVDSGVFATFGTDLDKFNLSLDADTVSAYAEAQEKMATSTEKLADAMKELNDALSDKNSGWGESGVSIASLSQSGGLGLGGSGMSEEQINQLNTTMSQAVLALTDIKNINTRQLTALREMGDVY